MNIPAAAITALLPQLCTRCGKCCKKQDYVGTLYASAEDMRRWDREGRVDILARVWRRGPDSSADAFLTVAGEQCTSCPWLRKDRDKLYKCRIHDTAPEPCVGYPVDHAQMVQDGCEILDGLARLGIDSTGWERDPDPDAPPPETT